MSRSRRDFLANSGLGLMGVAMAAKTAQASQATAGDQGGQASEANQPAKTKPATSPSTPGAPPAFGTAAPAGPAVTSATFSEAEKLVQVEMTPPDIAEAAGNWQQSMAPVYQRRTGPKKLSIPEAVAPATVWNPSLPGTRNGPAQDLFSTGSRQAPSLPHNEQDIAFAPVTYLSEWIRTRQITSERLTGIYLQRLETYNQKLNCVITLTREHALQQARAADQEIAGGHYRGPLHGIPWGAKDLLDTAGIPTTYGAEPYRNRIPVKDAVVTERLNAAGAVLVAKLSLGALALNDVWFGGQTMNPWLVEEGSSGSSAGPAAAVAAGLVGFAIGSETQGSIVSPSMRCGVTGLRPTYGRVPRTGAMTLSWTCDKLGPMARCVEDTMLVLHAISGPDPGDVASVPSKLDFDRDASIEGLRVGYFPAWMQQAPATEVDRAALATVKKLGMTPVEVSLPDWPYGSLNIILFAESAAAFEELTLSHKVDELREQVPDAWPNTFRQSRFLSAVDFVQADRMRRMVATEMDRIFSQVDLLLVPSMRDEFLVITNFTGQPSLTLRAGFVEVSEARSDWAPDPHRPLPRFNPPRRVPYGVTLVGGLFEEGTVAEAGIALEKAFGVAAERPAGF
jgi:Asp-tRNA(Asn)/Glu-tRNA(Gln) amidotransferase A subunit family amidase